MAGQLGDPARLRLLEFLLGAEHTAGECGAHRPVPEPGVGASGLPGRLRLRAIPSRRPVRLLRSGRPPVADLVTLARSLAADNAEAPGRLRPHDSPPEIRCPALAAARGRSWLVH
jgi:hypothetical protein